MSKHDMYCVHATDIIFISYRIMDSINKSQHRTQHVASNALLIEVRKYANVTSGCMPLNLSAGLQIDYVDSLDSKWLQIYDQHSLQLHTAMTAA